MDEEEGQFAEEEPTTDATDPTDATDTDEVNDTTDVTDTEDEAPPMPTDRAEDLMEDDINVTDSQVMIQLKEAEEEADSLRKEIAQIRQEIEYYGGQEELGEEASNALQEKQMMLMEKIALLDKLTKRIEKLMRLASKGRKDSEDATILDEDEEEEEVFPDDLLPRVVICSSWDDMMPKVVVCMDMKKPGGAKKLEGERDENGLTPEQREALDKERRCMAEERERMQCQLSLLEGEMRTMMRENDMLSRRIAQMRSDAENQPPFEFEMAVSAPNRPASSKPGTADAYTQNAFVGAALPPGSEVQGRMGILGDSAGLKCGCSRGGTRAGALPCGGPTEIPGKSVPCPAMGSNFPAVPSVPPFVKRCRKEFNNCPCGGGLMDPQLLPKTPPVDLNFKVNIQTPQSRQSRGGNEQNADPNRSNKVAQQLQEIEMEVRRMQRELSRAIKDKETLKAQQATLDCAKTSLM